MRAWPACDHALQASPADTLAMLPPQPKRGAVVGLLVRRIWIKLLAQQQVQVMHGQGELAVKPRSPSVRFVHFKFLCDAPKPHAQGHVFFPVAQLAEQPPDVIGALAGRPDSTQRGGRFDASCAHRLEQRAFELTAAGRSPGIDSASTVSAQGHTRLDRKSTRLNSSHGYISYAVF